MRKILLFLTLLFFTVNSQVYAGQAPSFSAKKVYDTQVSNKSTVNVAEGLVNNISKTLNNYVVYELDVNSINAHVSAKKASTNFALELGQQTVNFNLKLHDVVAQDFVHVEQTANGPVVHQKPAPFTYQGYTNESADKRAVLAIRDNWISGFFELENERYFITPVTQFDPSYKKANSVVLYTAKDSRYPSFECNVGKTMPTQEELVTLPNANLTYKKSAAIQCTEMAVAYDQGFKNLHGGVTGVENIIISRLNMVADLYTNWFEIDYALIELYEAAPNEITPDNNRESCQENFPNCSENTILDDFREWGEGQAGSPNFGNGFNSDPDVATFWTSRDIVDGNNDLNIGYSHFESICNERGYNICEDASRYRGNEAMQMTLWAHELGHNWNAYHVNQNSSYMMNSSVTSEAVNVTNSTINSIVEHRNSRTCLDYGACVAAQCYNDIQDGDETGIDCGGANCNPCPTCTDGIRNGDEVGPDCGGSNCPVCPVCPTSISSFPYAEGFESGLGQWSQTGGDNLDWTRNSNGTASSNTGPSAAYEGTSYMYIEASTSAFWDFSSTPDQTAGLISPCFNLNGKATASLTFQYHMYGDNNDMNLDLEVSIDGGNTWSSAVWSDTGDQGNQWNAATVNLDAYVNEYVTLRFWGTTGATYRSDIAIDDIELDAGGPACTPGTACDDNDACTTGETFDSSCQCNGGTLVDADNDTVCDANDVCANGDDTVDTDGDGTPDACDNCDNNTVGDTCDDGDACTTNDELDSNCNCAGTVADADGDGVCDANDICSSGDDNADADGDGTPDACDNCDDTLNGTACDDNDVCTTGETYDANCNCNGGTFQDADNDTVCDANDVCANGDDNADADGDGTPDACDNCNNNTNGTACDDGDACTTNDVLDSNCNCAGTVADADGDGVCDANDICSSGDDTADADGDGTPDACDNCDNSLNGTACDDGDACTTGEAYDANCNCAGGTVQDADGDGVCDANDVCSSGDDTIDADADGTPDACDTCPNDANNACGMPTYCATNGGNTFYGYINRVTFDQIDNTSGDNGGYEDFTNLSTNVTPGSSVSLSLTAGYGWFRSADDWKAWIDFNRDGDFDDAGEEVFSGTGTNTQTATVNIPSNASAGSTGMRVSLSNNPPTSCASSSYGEVEDYTVVISGGGGNCADADGDGVCDTNDVCASGDDTIDTDGDGTPDACDNCDNTTTGTACNDNDPCTTNDEIDSNCNCAGTLADADNDGVCDANDICSSGDDNADTDGDGTPDACDNCDNTLTGTACDDNDACTTGETYDANCNCGGGTIQDADNDGVCDANDVCSSGDDNADADGDGTPDACDNCDNSTVGNACDDNDACTSNDVLDSNCNCAGTFDDADNDGVCDANDICAGGDDTADADNDGTPDACDTCDNSLTGTACDDGDACTTGETYDANCACGGGTFQDADNDSVCDSNDVCANGDDTIDSDNDNTPDACDTCPNDANNACGMPSYCASNGGNTFFGYINKVTFNQIDNTSGDNGGYEDFTNLSTGVAPGSSVSISLNGGYGWFALADDWKVWIDFNKDGDFDDAGEEVFSGTGTNTQTGTVNIPSNASLGSTGMRVSLSNNPPSPCASSAYGEVEDYTINITNNPVRLASPNAGEIKVYPNPAKHFLYVDLAQVLNTIDKENTVQLKVFSTDGKLQLENKTNAASLIEVNIIDLPPNQYYFISIESEGINLQSTKFLKL